MKTYFEKLIPAFLIITFFFVLAFLYSKLTSPMSLSLNSTVTNKSDIFTVTGEGSVFIQPDIAYVSAGISQTTSTVKEAQTQINKVINQITSGLKSLGIDSKDIKTTSYSINPTYDWSTRIQKITGYSASTQLNIKVIDIDKVNDVIDSVTSNGANQVNGITFDTEDRQNAEETARQQAITEANQKAQTAAKAAGFQLGKIIGYSENSFDSNIISPQSYTKMALSVDEAAAGGGTNIETGSEEVKITVVLNYQIN